MRGGSNSAVGRGRRLSPQKGSNFLENMNTCSYLPNMDVSPDEEGTSEIEETLPLLGDATRRRIMAASLAAAVRAGDIARRGGSPGSLGRHPRIRTRVRGGKGLRE